MSLVWKGEGGTHLVECHTHMIFIRTLLVSALLARQRGRTCLSECSFEFGGCPQIRIPIVLAIYKMRQRRDAVVVAVTEEGWDVACAGAKVLGLRDVLGAGVGVDDIAYGSHGGGWGDRTDLVVVEVDELHRGVRGTKRGVVWSEVDGHGRTWYGRAASTWCCVDIVVEGCYPNWVESPGTNVHLHLEIYRGCRLLLRGFFLFVWLVRCGSSLRPRQ